jgi:hypothetical protein
MAGTRSPTDYMIDVYPQVRVLTVNDRALLMASMSDSDMKSKSSLERVMGIEPTLAAWEAAVLPLNYTRRSVLGTPATGSGDRGSVTKTRRMILKDHPLVSH